MMSFHGAMNAREPHDQFIGAVRRGDSEMGRQEFIALVACMIALAALSIDIMLPALPQVGAALGIAEANDRQSIIIVYLLAFALGQLVFGRLSDLYGRKPVLLVGMTVFVGGSVAAALSFDAQSMLVARAIQGIGAAAPRVIAVALVRDRYVGRAMARVMSFAVAVFFIVPVLAPSIGQGLLQAGTWRWVFDFLTVAGIGLTLWCLRLPETPRAFVGPPLSLTAAIGSALGTRQTIGYSTAAGLMLGCVLAYISSAQQIFVDVFGLGQRFPQAFAAIAIMIAVANAFLINRIGVRRLSHASLAAFVVIAAVLVVEAVLGRAGFWPFIATMMPLYLLFGFIAPNFNSLAMEPQGDNAGMAASVVGCVTTGIAAGAGGVVAHLFDGTVLPLAVDLLALSVMAFLVVIWVEGARGLFRSSVRPPQRPALPEALRITASVLTAVTPGSADVQAAPACRMPPRPQTPQTKVTHAGRVPGANFGFLNPPVFRGSTVLFPTAEKFVTGDQPYTYGRKSTPTVRALEEAIAEIEGGHSCSLTGSGYQAVTAAIMAFVKSGDHILMVDTVYQPTREFCTGILAKFGVATTYYDPLIGEGVSRLIRPNTRLIFAESPGSQTLEVQDIPAIARVAEERGVWLLMDNTWASPLYFKPFEHGVHVSIQAATKYIVGHADAVLGSITCNADAAKYVAKTKDLLGICPGSEETYLGMRGLRTLPMRLAQHHKSALRVASWLEERPEVSRVLHPALPSHPQHHIWERDFLGASGLFSIVLKPARKEAVWAMLDGLTLFGIGFSWGGYESLIIPFDPSGYRTATTWRGEGPALRLHIGLEDVDELIADLEAGFDRLAAVAQVSKQTEPASFN
jgi:cysteine-S-conjugate beta-lyase